MRAACPVVVGSGSWGTALAHLLAHAHDCVWLVSRDAELARSINLRHENVRYLPGLSLHEGVRATLDPLCPRAADLLVFAVPCQNLRQALRQYAPPADGSQPPVVVNAAKGLELETLVTPRDIVAREAPHLAGAYAALSGPSFAREVVQNKPTAVVLGCEDARLGARLRACFSVNRFRAYTSRDVIGVELGGAIKNVIAIAAGLADGLDFGHNARSALISRGLAEMGRLALALGALPATLSGLSGLGDLVLTCTGDLSRNRQTGLRIAKGESPEHIARTLGSVAEGVKTTIALHALAARHQIDMPIVDAVHAVLHEGLPVADVVRRLFERELREE
jgi:glycerol-3-phosphate dehydrogenase (NAD(P)+)